MKEAPSALWEPHPSCVGIDSIRHVHLIENHDQALHIWRAAGVKQRMLVHIDAHHDMRWMGDQDVVTIANFICPALKQDLVREVVWVAPEGSFDNRETRQSILRHLKRILKEYPGASQSPLVEKDRITASVLGKKLTVCPVRAMPALSEAVLLDIDVDYFIIPRVSHGESDRHASLPWCWPSDLVAQLHGIPTDLITVAFSVEGGYTPLKWKYLGDELVVRLTTQGFGGSDVEGTERMRAGGEAEFRGEISVSESNYRQAMDLLPCSAAPPYRLARLLASVGRVDEGRRLYGQAVALDRSYGGAYSGAGFHSYWRGAFEAAKREFCDILALNPEDPFAHLGLGLLAKRRKGWDEAEQHLRSALTVDNCLVDAQHALGDVLVKQDNQQDAIKAYERALKLGLMGHKPLSGPISTHTQDHQLLDPLHCVAHRRLASLYEQGGAITKAISALRIAMAGGMENTAMRIRLARLYAKQRQWWKSAGEILKAVMLSPKDAWSGCGRLSLKLRAHKNPLTHNKFDE